MKLATVGSEKITSTLRFSASYYLSDAVKYEELIKANRYVTLGKLAEEIFTSGRCKRNYTSKEYGVPFLGNNEVTSASPKIGCKYISRKFYNDEKALLKHKMILTGRVGQDTVGEYSFCPHSIQNSIGSDNVIRIVINQGNHPGYVYAFLASKYGYALTRRFITGGAQPFITEKMLATIPVPLLQEGKRSEIDRLINEATILRDTANEKLNSAQEMLCKQINISEEFLRVIDSPLERDIAQHFTINAKQINTKTFRARNYSVRKDKILQLLKQGSWDNLGDILITTPSYGARYKRLQGSLESGIELFSQGDIFMSKPEGKLISRNSIKNINEEIVHNGTTLIPAQGTLGEGEIFGRAVFVWGHLDKKLIAGHAMRFIPNTKRIKEGYLYAILSSQFWFRLLRNTVYGTNLLGFIVDLINEYPIPRFSQELESQIDSIVKDAHSDFTEAIRLENSAISIIEKEISKWQK